VSAPAGRRIVLPAAPLVDGVTSLRSWSDGDLPALAETGRDPDVTRWMGLPGQYRESDARAYLMSRYDGVHAGIRAPFAIVATGGRELLGSIALAHFGWEDRRGEVGYWLGAASQRVAERAGFTREAVLRSRWSTFGGERHDMVCFGLLASDS
jgi:ribosomal-protein-serine acetyltransferase